ncbi:hypothetical protein N665_0733s0025 [Sinapis alba]|nr:hypothetical protein N665_0733s0025 [Sinapis alba]
MEVGRVLDSGDEELAVKALSGGHGLEEMMASLQKPWSKGPGGVVARAVTLQINGHEEESGDFAAAHCCDEKKPLENFVITQRQHTAG